MLMFFQSHLALQMFMMQLTKIAEEISGVTTGQMGEIFFLAQLMQFAKESLIQMMQQKEHEETLNQCSIILAFQLSF
jgi:hypothetical protein